MTPRAVWSSPEISRGVQRAFCSGVPCTTIGCGPKRLTCTEATAAMAPSLRATSCIMMAASVTPRPAPPYSVGMVIPSQPASAMARWNSNGNFPSSSRASQ